MINHLEAVIDMILSLVFASHHHHVCWLPAAGSAAAARASFGNTPAAEGKKGNTRIYLLKKLKYPRHKKKPVESLNSFIVLNLINSS